MTPLESTGRTWRGDDVQIRAGGKGGQFAKGGGRVPSSATGNVGMGAGGRLPSGIPAVAAANAVRGDSAEVFAENIQWNDVSKMKSAVRKDAEHKATTAQLRKSVKSGHLTDNDADDAFTASVNKAATKAGFKPNAHTLRYVANDLSDSAFPDAPGSTKSLTRWSGKDTGTSFVGAKPGTVSVTPAGKGGPAPYASKPTKGASQRPGWMIGG